MLILRKFISGQARPKENNYKYGWEKDLALEICGIAHGAAAVRFDDNIVGRYIGDEKRAIIFGHQRDRMLYAIETPSQILELSESGHQIILDWWQPGRGWRTIKN